MERTSQNDWQILEDASLVTEEYKRLKAQGKVVTNYPLIGTEIEDKCKHSKVLWAVKEKSVSVLVKEDDLYRLYFITAEPNEYGMPNFEADEPIVTEIYEKSGKERCNEVVASLQEKGFECAKRYDRYEIKMADVKNGIQSAKEPGITYSDDKSESIYALIYECFEPIGAQLPKKDELSAYIGETNVIAAYKEDELVAAVVYKIKSGMATEEYVYTPIEKRGMGYSKIIEAKLIDTVKNIEDVRRLNAWVEEKNISSLRLHSAFGYTKTSDYKLTLVTYQK